MNNPVLLGTIISIQSLENLELAAANNALTGFGRVDPKNKAFGKMKELTLIDETGQPFDLEILLDALSFEINRRAEAGIFN